MCGFSGIYSRTGKLSALELDPLLPEMLNLIEHRGPDEVGFYRDSHVAFAHCRLSIVDLAHGQQPMVDSDSNVSLVYNGEIFNYPELREELSAKGHRFNTNCDTEVVLRAYLEFGQNFVQYLNGQFAIAIWDPRSRQLLLIRDRVGICPLFYATESDRVVFGSEVKAMLPAMSERPQLNLSVLDEIFTCWTPLGRDSIFQGIKTVQPGELICISETDTVHTKYWQFDYHRDRHLGHESELADQLLTLLTDAVKVRLRSDVPVGAYLSGGLDSSAITALINQLSPDRLKTFSLGFNNADFDERDYQKTLIDSLHVDHHHLQVSDSDICDHFIDSIWHTESPVLRTAPVPMGLLSASVHEQGYKVVMTGEGADEILGGYDLFKETKIREFWSRQPDSVTRPLLLKQLYPYMNLPDQGAAEYLKAFFGIMLEQPDNALFSHMPRWMTTSKSKMFYSDDMKAALNDSVLSRAEQLLADARHYSPFHRAQFIESTVLMPGYLLSSQGDRMLAKNSVEGRFPFLDHRLIEFSSRLPETLKMKALKEKFLLKKALASELPRSIIERKKQPFRAPDGSLIKKLVNRDDCREYLSKKNLLDTGLFSFERVNRLINKSQNKPLNTSESQALIGILSTQVVAGKFKCKTF